MEPSNIVSNVATKDGQALNELEKKIFLKCFKDGNKLKTHVIGINYFISKDDLKPFIKTIKKKLGCGGGSVLQENGITTIIFSGNQIDNIKNIIISKDITTSSNIKY